MKYKKERAYPEIIMIGLNIGFWKFRDQTKNGTSKKIHHNQEKDTNTQVNEKEKIEEAHSMLIAFIFPDTHWFRYEHWYIDAVDEAWEQDHGCKNKKINIGLDITAEIPGNNNG